MTKIELDILKTLANGGQVTSRDTQLQGQAYPLHALRVPCIKLFHEGLARGIIGLDFQIPIDTYILKCITEKGSAALEANA